MSGIFDKHALAPLSGKRTFPDLSPRDPVATSLATERPFSSRRRRMWELPKKYHCPVIGVCFDVGELRRMISKELDYPPQTTDYVWLTIAVGVCTDRCRLSEQFNKVLDKRYQLMIRRFATCKTAEEQRAQMPDIQDRQRLALRLQDAETEVRLLRSRERELLKEVEKLGDLVRSAEQSVERQTAPVGLESCGDVCPSVADKSISGKSVLCVGGRSSSISAYRQVVEEGGGRFMHHDGGLEENLHRIDGALAAADIVICQVGCISHNAYWRVKELCKRTGKPCMFLRNSGLASFGRVVGEASRLSDKSVE